MPEKQNNTAEINIKNLTRWRLGFLDFANRFLFFFNLKDSKRFWGILYDSVSKQPLDPVIVKLVYTDGYEIEQAVTDLGGRYGFLARKGKFKIFPRKSNYTFPSKLVTRDRDGIYENIYHGEFFTVAGDEVVAPNIPMDPEKFDWNQKAKQQVLITHPYAKLFLRRLFGVFFWFGLAFSLVYFWANYGKAGMGIYSVLAAYFVIIFLAILLPEPRLWGKITVSGPESPQNLFLELHNIDFPSVISGTAAVNDNGKFLLRTNKGKYLLSVSSIDGKKNKNVLASLPVKIGRSGVLNGSLEIKL